MARRGSSTPAAASTCTTACRSVDLPDVRRVGPLRRHRAGVERRAIAEQIAGAELRIYEGGHAFFYQDRHAFADIVAFLGGLSASLLGQADRLVVDDLVEVLAEAVADGRLSSRRRDVAARSTSSSPR